MSAMSASSGLMPLSLISEHKAAQGGPPPVQPLARTPEKHPLVQAPKPTPNGMEPSPPLVPVLSPPQPDPQPSLPCGGKSETGSEEGERSGGAVPDLGIAQPAEEPPPGVVAGAVSEGTGGGGLPVSLPESGPPEAVVALAGGLALAQALPHTLPLPASPTPAPVEPRLPPLQQPTPTPHQLLDSEPKIEEPIEGQEATPETGVETGSTGGAERAEQPEALGPAQPVLAGPATPAPPAPAPAPAPVQASVDSTPTPPNPTPTPTASASVVAPPQAAPTPSTPTPSLGRPPKRKSANIVKSTPGALPVVAAPAEELGDDRKSKRKRLPTQVYQSPIPELNLIAKISKIDKVPASSDEKLIVFYRNEFIAVRNAEGGFYVCQAMQNVYKGSSKIKIRWLSQLANTDHYSPDFYDYTEFDCILTNLNLERLEKDKYRLPGIESKRTESILKRALDVEKGIAPPEEANVTEEHPDGLDLSLYRNEEQLKKRKRGSKSKINKKQIKKPIDNPVAKRTGPVRRKTRAILEVAPKKVVIAPAQSVPQKRLGRSVKVDKPVVQRIVAAKKIGKRKAVGLGKSPAPSTPPVKELVKKKEILGGKPSVVGKRRSEPQPPAVPEKKLKTGASKTRSGVAGGPSSSGSGPQARSRRASTRTK